MGIFSRDPGVSVKVLLLVFLVTPVMGLFGCKDRGTTGAGLFSLHCASCHPGGGNTVNPRRTLRRDALNAGGIRTPGDIVAKMRNPDAGMPRFSPAVIPDRDAELIAEYVLASFR